jgi:nitroreductase
VASPVDGATSHFDALAASRRSWLGFDYAPIERGLMLRLVATAATAPSEFNLQPWQFAVVESSAFDRIIEAVHPHNRPKLAGASAVVAVFGDLTVIDGNERAQRYFGRGIVSTRDFAIRNASLAAMQFMLAAHAHDLGTRPMTGFDPVTMSAAIDAPPGWIPCMIVAIGYRGSPTHPVESTRRSVDEIVTFVA